MDSSFLAKHQRKCSSDDGIHYVDDDDGVEFALDSRHLNKVHEGRILKNLSPTGKSKIQKKANFFKK